MSGEGTSPKCRTEGRNMAKLGTVVLKGASGVRYPFDVYPFDQAFNQIGAVYSVTFAYTKPPDSTIWHNHIYIGQPGNLPERFSGHHKAKCFQEHKANRICVHPDGNEKSRLAKEADLLNDRTTPCND